LKAIKGLFAEMDVEFYISEYPGSLAEKVDRDGSADVIVAVGGDGTVFEIINGDKGRNRPLSILACGTGNSLAHDLGVIGLANGIKALRKEQIKKVDVLEVALENISGEKRKYFSASTVASGFVADTVILANSKMKKFGELCYPLSAIFSAGKQKCRKVLLREGNQESLQVPTTGMLVSNCTYAGNFRAFPYANIDDGQFDYLVMNAGFLGQMRHNLSILSGGKSHKKMDFRKTEALAMGFDAVQPMILDGEIFTDIVSCSVRLIPGGIECLSLR
jgi:diacylglycerol kinase family enzyme